MGYALFTARKLSLTTRLNTCNANLMSITEKENSLSSSIFAKQNAANIATNEATLKAYNEHSVAIQNLDSKNENYEADKLKAETALQTKMAEINVQSAMTNAEIQELKQIQTMYDLQKQNLETQLQAYQKELESVEKSEGDAIKNSAPKF